MRGLATLVLGLLALGSSAAAEPIPGFAPKDLPGQRRLESRFRVLLEREIRRPGSAERGGRIEGTDWPAQEIEVIGPPLLARALTLLSRKGWRPRRTVLIVDLANGGAPAAADPGAARSGVRARIRIGPDADATAIASRGVEALRLAMAALPWRDHADTVERAFAELDELAGEALGAFDRNPPPTRALREALADARRAARGWESVSTTWLERVRSLRSVPDREAAGRASQALLSTPAAIDLDEARRAVAAVDRGALVAALLAASVPAQAISAQLREAVAALESVPERSPDP